VTVQAFVVAGCQRICPKTAFFEEARALQKRSEVFQPAQFEHFSWFGFPNRSSIRSAKDPHETDKPRKTDTGFRDASRERSARGVRAAASGNIIIRLARDGDGGAAEGSACV
jgi:hypothetical protein